MAPSKPGWGNAPGPRCLRGSRTRTRGMNGLMKTKPEAKQANWAVNWALPAPESRPPGSLGQVLSERSFHQQSTPCSSLRHRCQGSVPVTNRRETAIFCLLPIGGGESRQAPARLALCWSWFPGASAGLTEDTVTQRAGG